MTAYQYDGTYTGASQRIAGKDQSCDPGREIAVDVHKGRLRLPWHEPQVFDARVLPDGRLFATTSSVIQAEKHMTVIPTLHGQISPAGLVADYGTRWCHYRLEARLPPIEQHLSQRTGGVVTGH